MDIDKRLVKSMQRSQHTNSPRILVVEDVQWEANLIKAQLIRAGLVVTTCSGDDAARQAEALLQRPNRALDLALIDLHLQDGDGEQLAAKARERGVIVILMTADPNLLLTLDEADSVHFVSKPVTQTQINWFLAKYAAALKTARDDKAALRMSDVFPSRADRSDAERRLEKERDILAGLVQSMDSEYAAYRIKPGPDASTTERLRYIEQLKKEVAEAKLEEAQTNLRRAKRLIDKLNRAIDDGCHQPIAVERAPRVHWMPLRPAERTAVHLHRGATAVRVLAAEGSSPLLIVQVEAPVVSLSFSNRPDRNNFVEAICKATGVESEHAVVDAAAWSRCRHCGLAVSADLLADHEEQCL